MEVEADITEKVKDGKKYWDIKSWKHNYELQKKAELDLENLFEGNEVLGDYTLKFPKHFLWLLLTGWTGLVFLIYFYLKNE